MNLVTDRVSLRETFSITDSRYGGIEEPMETLKDPDFRSLLC